MICAHIQFRSTCAIGSSGWWTAVATYQQKKKKLIIKIIIYALVVCLSALWPFHSDGTNEWEKQVRTDATRNDKRMHASVFPNRGSVLIAVIVVLIRKHTIIPSQRLITLPFSWFRVSVGRKNASKRMRVALGLQKSALRDRKLYFHVANWPGRCLTPFRNEMRTLNTNNRQTKESSEKFNGC